MTLDCILQIKINIKIFVLILVLQLGFLPVALFADEESTRLVSYPASDSNPYYYKRVKYFVEILDLALSKSNHSYQLAKVSLPFMNETRSKTNLTAGVYDVHWLNAQPFLESDLHAIRIPLCMGLTGWRILFIRPESQAEFSTITNFNDLKKYTAGNGNDWPEAVLYQHSNLPQKLSGSWKGLFNMLNQQRVDYLSRSALEILDEEDAFPELNLKIESNLVIHYPAAYYFYVRKSDRELAEDIKIGLERAIADGSFDAIFNRYFSEKIRRLNLPNRHRIEISDADSQRLVLDKKSNPSYWYQIE